MAKIEYLKADKLYFDRQNPRLVEYDISSNSNEKTILTILWEEMNIKELVLSILSHVFFENEPMYAVVEEGKHIIVEGNRRLAAVKSIINPVCIEASFMHPFRSRIMPELVEKLKTHLPVVVLSSRQEAWRYIGFKHINGAAKWGAYAKAKFVAQVHKEFNIPIEKIAEQIGDANKEVLKIYRSFMVLQQASRETDFFDL